MKVALDATYSLGEALSGVGVYSREILNGLAAESPADHWEWFYRTQRFRSALGSPKPANVSRRWLADSFGNRSAGLFHGLNQRLPKRRFRRQIATFHDLFVLSGEYSTAEFRTRFAAQAREAAAAADLIIAVSAFTGQQVEDYLGVPSSRIRVIHHGVLPRSIPAMEREKVVLCVGAIQTRKNQAGLVRAFASMPEDWRLVLAGSQGFGAEETLREIAASSAATRIEITGYLPEQRLSEWYGRAGIFAFPSLDEGFGMPILEAMAAGIPVITGNKSALPEIAGNAALLVDAADENDLAGALVALAGSENRRGELAELGKKRAAGFTWTRAVRETLEVYRDLLPG